LKLKVQITLEARELTSTSYQLKSKLKIGKRINKTWKTWNFRKKKWRDIQLLKENPNSKKLQRNFYTLNKQKTIKNQRISRNFVKYWKCQLTFRRILLKSANESQTINDIFQDIAAPRKLEEKIIVSELMKIKESILFCNLVCWWQKASAWFWTHSKLTTF
jgi:hypothetical protein